MIPSFFWTAMLPRVFFRKFLYLIYRSQKFDAWHAVSPPVSALCDCTRLQWGQF
jgi:hypothetical protein